jgi:hypothetical protein
MFEYDKTVDTHLFLTSDGKCDKEGHELIPRACIHCGLTIHEISDANDGVLPMRDTPADRAEREWFITKRLKDAQASVKDMQDTVVDLKQQLKTHKEQGE